MTWHVRCWQIYIFCHNNSMHLLDASIVFAFLMSQSGLKYRPSIRFRWFSSSFIGAAMLQWCAHLPCNPCRMFDHPLRQSFWSAFKPMSYPHDLDDSGSLNTEIRSLTHQAVFYERLLLLLFQILTVSQLLLLLTKLVQGNVILPAEYLGIIMEYATLVRTTPVFIWNQVTTAYGSHLLFKNTLKY